MSTIPQIQAVDPVEVADMVMEAAFTRDAARAMTHAELTSDDLWSYGCNRNPFHIGIIFTSDPAGMPMIHGGHWTAAYRPKGERAFWGAAQDVICQQCFRETGEKVALRIAVVPSPDPRLGLCFTLLPEWRRRFAHKQSRAALAAFMPKAESPKPENSKEKTDGGSTPRNKPELTGKSAD